MLESIGMDLLLTKEVARNLRIPESTLRYWRGIGLGPKGFKLGRRVVYRAQDVREWLDEQAAAGRS